MSYRHTFVTNFLYKSGKYSDLDEIKQILELYGCVYWQGGYDGIGYFHGVLKDLNGVDTVKQIFEIQKSLEVLGVKLKMVIEY